MQAPRFSIVTPVYETPPSVLWGMLESVRSQTFQSWEACIVDDGSTAPHVRAALERAALEDPRIKVEFSESNSGIVDTSNRALEMAEGEFIVLLDHDDELHPDALELVNKAIEQTPQADYVYTDEDKIDLGGRHSGPFFKPDWSPERMRTQMYTCHLSVLRRSLVEEVGGFDPEYEGSQDWDLILKVTERARAVLHVPRVLYHWRTIESSVASGGQTAKPWAFEAGTRALQTHCERIGIKAEVRRDEAEAGVYHLEPALDEKPLVSIVIPTAGTSREVRYEPVILVNHCVESIISRSTYENYEIVVVYDEPIHPGILQELRQLGGERLRLVPFDRPFSFSAKVNIGAVQSRGEHLVMLNDDVEVATPDWIERMVMYSSLPGVGAVGGRLIWEDGRLQHVGIRFEASLPGHEYYGFAGDFSGYANCVHVAQNLLAVTGACLMTRRELFEELGGLSTTLPINYNDVDYCLKVNSSGRRVVYDPDLVMYHFESSSRPIDVEDWEKDRLRARWSHLTSVDPYSNPNMRRGVPRLSSTFAWARRRRLRIRRKRRAA